MSSSIKAMVTINYVYPSSLYVCHLESVHSLGGASASSPNREARISFEGPIALKKNTSLREIEAR